MKRRPNSQVDSKSSGWAPTSFLVIFLAQNILKNESYSHTRTLTNASKPSGLLETPRARLEYLSQFYAILRFRCWQVIYHELQTELVRLPAQTTFCGHLHIESRRPPA